MKKQRRKSLREEVVQITAEGEESRVHFTLTKKGKTQIQVTDFTENPELIKFLTIQSGRSQIKLYAFKNNPDWVFIRIGEEFITLNKFNWRELLGGIMKGSRWLGLMRGGRKSLLDNTRKGGKRE